MSDKDKVVSEKTIYRNLVAARRALANVSIYDKLKTELHNAALDYKQKINDRVAKQILDMVERNTNIYKTNPNVLINDLRIHLKDAV